jgi:type I restriction enzyme S subunit
MNDIPKHWQIKKLGEVCVTTSGGTPNRGNSKFYQGNIPWVKSGELDRGLILDTEEKISEEAIKNSSAKIFPKGTLLIALYGATIGKLAFLGIDAATNQAVCGIYKNENIDSNYLFNFLFYKKASLVKQGIGGAQPNISQGILRNLGIPIPPFKEQQAIVAKIEELLSELENGKQQLLTAEQQLKVYRQSLLKWAFEGKELSPFEDFIDTSQNGLSKRTGTTGEEYKVLRLADITNNMIENSSPRKIVMDENEIEKYKIKNDDLICIRVNGSKDLVGKLVHVSTQNEKDNWAFCDHFIRFRLNPTKAFSKYFHYYFSTVIVRKYIHDNMVTSAGQNTVSQGTIKNVPVPVCSLKEQQLIVSELESKLTVCDKIEETINQSLLQAETLRQSILKKAFEGKLV